MSARRERLVVLGGLVVVLAGVIVYRFVSGPAGEAVPSPGSPNPPAAAAAPGAPAVVDVRIELLDAAPADEEADANRNPFRFRPPPAPPKPAVAAVRSEPTLAASAAPSGPPPPPPITLKFIGFLDPAESDDRAAIFSDTRGNVFGGREGDVIEGRYRVLRVGRDSTEIAYLDGRGRTTIRLSGQ
jgi:hypothetical protein